MRWREKLSRNKINKSATAAAQNPNLATRMPEAPKTPISTPTLSAVGSGGLLDCFWRADDDGIWNTTCGEMFVICNDDGPVDNGFRFCAYCGGALRQKQSNDKVRRATGQH